MRFLIVLLIALTSQISFAASEDAKASCYFEVLEKAGRMLYPSEQERIRSIIYSYLSQFETTRLQITPSIIQVNYKDYSNLKAFVKDTPLRNLFMSTRAGKSWYSKSLVKANDQEIRRIFNFESCVGVLY